MLNWIIDFSLRHRLLVIVASLRAGGRRRACRCAISISMPFPTPRRCRCRSTRWRRRWARKKSSSGSRFRSSRRSAACRAWRACGRVSKFGLSQVVVTFEDGTDIYFARQLVNERLATVELADGIERPKMGPVATGLGEVFHYVVTGSGQRRHRAAHDSRLGHQAEDAHRARRGRDQQLGRLRKAVPGADRSEPAHQVRPDVRRGRAGGRREQPQRRRRQRPRRHAVGAGAGRGPHDERRRRSRASSSRPRTACRFAWATWPTWRSAPKSAAAPSPPTARAKSSWAWASC